MRTSLHLLSFTTSVVLAVGAITFAASDTASAHGSYATTWSGRYPTSTTLTKVTTGTGQSCALCHFTVGGGSNWNAYGWKMRQGTQAGQSALTAIINAEAVNSDLDPTGSTNLAEITANTQPGWTPGAANIEYFASSTTPNLSAPASIPTPLDPTPPPAAYCFGDGAGTACPCANSSVVGANEGCLNSLAIAGKLVVTGTASISADTLSLAGSQVPNGPGLYFQGTTQLGAGLGAVFGDGLRCVGGTVIRLGIVQAAGNASTYPSGVTAPNNVPVSVKGLNTAGQVRNYQLWYRDSGVFCSASVFNLTNAMTLTWAP